MSNTTNPDVEHVLNRAREELIGLQHKKAALMKRIGTIKQTIAGLADLFGNDLLDVELVEILDRRGHSRPPGFTNECRFALMDTRDKMTARAVCDWICERNPTKLTHHKDPLASVTTVLNRLVSYGEAEATVLDNGRRAWRWRSEMSVEQPNREDLASAP